jgi:hypothetical protein
VLAVVVFQVGQEPLVLRRTGIASISMTVGLSQHPDEHCSKCSVLLAVDQELGEGVALSGSPQNSPIRSARSRSGSTRTWSTAQPRSAAIQGIGRQLHQPSSRHVIARISR